MKLPVRRMRGARFLLVCAAVGVAVLGATAVVASRAAASPAVNTKLFAYDGEPNEPSHGIWLKDANGALVTHLDPGTYDIEVDDHSAGSSFHLTGPGVDIKTEVDFVGQTTWTVTFTDGTYSYHCDVMPDVMHGLFTVGNPPPASAASAAQSASFRRSWASHLRRRRGDSALHIVERAPCVTDSHASGPASSIGRVGSPAPDFLTERRLVCA